jgi:hypothetical protein
MKQRTGPDMRQRVIALYMKAYTCFFTWKWLGEEFWRGGFKARNLKANHVAESCGYVFTQLYTAQIWIVDPSELLTSLMLLTNVRCQPVKLLQKLRVHKHLKKEQVSCVSGHCCWPASLNCCHSPRDLQWPQHNSGLRWRLQMHMRE